MLDNKIKVRDESKHNKSMLNAVGVATCVRHEGKSRDVYKEINGVEVVIRGMKYGVNNGERMVLEPQFESIVILENGWMIAARHGIYYLYDKDGKMYKGLSFLKRENAIRFAKTL